MSKVAIESSTLTALADAVRDTTGKTGLLTPADMTSGVNGTITLALDSITVKKRPTVLEYNAGDTFEPAGGEVIANYTKVNTGDKVSFPVTDWTVSPTVVAEDTTSVDIVYQEKNKRVTSPVPVTIVPMVEYADWGDEKVFNGGKLEWWTALHDWVKNVSKPQERKALVGKMKNVSFNSYFYSNNGMCFRVIGADQDGPKTLTFQAFALFNGSTVNDDPFGPSSLWEDSTARLKCDEFLELLDFKDLILPVTKLTFNGTELVETTNKIWLPSAREMGLTKGPEGEFTKGGDGKAYSYYDSDEKRMKYISRVNGNSDMNVGTGVAYMTRSRYDDKQIIMVANYGSYTYAKSTNNLPLVPAFTI